MQLDEFTTLLAETDFHIDPLGRVVIDNPDILAAINGAMSGMGTEDLLINGGCSNASCN